MKPRRVVVTIELESELPLNLLRSRKAWWHAYWGAMASGAVPECIHQVQVNVVRAQPKRRKEAR